MLDKYFVPYDRALKLKELGFDEPCFKAYTEEYERLINISNYHTNTSIKIQIKNKVCLHNNP